MGQRNDSPTEPASAETVLMWLRFFALFVGAGFLSAVIFHTLYPRLLQVGFPWDTYLFDPADRFNDWHNSVREARSMDPYYKYYTAYLPFSYIAFLSAARLSALNSTLLYLSVSIFLLAIAACCFWKVQLANMLKNESELRRIYAPVLLALVIVLCYPLHFGLDRGNIDTWICALCILYVVLLNTRYAGVGSFALGVAIAFKGYPVALCLLALPIRRYFQALLPAVVGLVLTIYAFSFLNGGYHRNVAGLRMGMQAFRAQHVLGLLGTRYSADPYDAIRIVTLKWWHVMPGQALLTVYSLLSAGFALLCVYFTLFVPAKRWRRVMAVCLVAIIFPDVAADYKLLMLLPGLLCFIAEAKVSGRNSVVAFCLGGLLIPKNYYQFFMSYAWFRVSVGSLISPVLLIGLACAVLADRRAWEAAFRQTPARIAWFLSPWLPGLVGDPARRRPELANVYAESLGLEPL